VTRPGFALAVLLTLGLSGCGVRGALDAPNAASGGAATTGAQADSGQGKKAGEAPKPHQGFILDRLIQ
jgi:predicted small lipoprotein YifL